MNDRHELEDEQTRKLLRRKDRVEALAWLTGAPGSVDRNVGEMEHDDSVALVRKLYDMGALKVIAVEIGRSPNRRFESTDTLIVELPADPGARLLLIKWNNDRSLEMGFEDLETERGQRYLLVWFD